MKAERIVLTEVGDAVLLQSGMVVQSESAETTGYVFMEVRRRCCHGGFQSRLVRRRWCSTLTGTLRVK